ncbi:hypothetical protein CDEST_06956 [Colletotrichum destructivum]|uniref:LysM domain-containing protein n=1 Tax=Colletotrichum destructivum TaxID=34406 RepID=A0AAX4IEY1_9PEZI|nr:hypothetical protein CDEST_06956 [Colletotrichum destructivum]
MTNGMKVRLLRDASVATRPNTPCAVDVEEVTGLSPLPACDWQFYNGFDTDCYRVDGRTLADIVAPGWRRPTHGSLLVATCRVRVTKSI